MAMFRAAFKAMRNSTKPSALHSLNSIIIILIKHKHGL